MEKNNVTLEIKQATQEIELEKTKTQLKKSQLISELKSGLGDEIKKNPNKVKIIKKTRYQKFVLALKKIFTKF